MRVWDLFPVWDPRLPIPDSRLGFAGIRSLGFRIREFLVAWAGIPVDAPQHVKSSSLLKSSEVVATVELFFITYLPVTYQDLDNQNSKHKIKACTTISSSNSFLKIDSIFLMALLY
jgi:hypothetical protein